MQWNKLNAQLVYRPAAADSETKNRRKILGGKLPDMTMRMLIMDGHSSDSIVL
jgi:hypothetical protein